MPILSHDTENLKARIEHLERVLVQAREAMNLAASFQEGGTLKAREAIAAIDEALKENEHG